MQHERFAVKFVIANSCFAQLPDIWLRRLETKENVIEILHNGKTYYLSCIPCMNIDKTLCIGATFAKTLNIQEEDEVFVSSVKNVPTLSSIKIAPRTTTDLELLELLKDKVQSNLLNEVRIVAKGQPVVAWISKFSSVTFIVDDSEPKFAYGLLEQFTEVHVLDAIANSKMESEDQKAATNESNPLAKILSCFTKEKDDRYSKDTAANQALLQSFRKKTAPCVFRVYPLPKFRSFDQSNPYDLIPRCPFHILIPRNHLPKGSQWTSGIMCKIKKVLESWKDASTNARDEIPKNVLRDDSSDPKSKLVARIYILEDILEKCSASDREYFDFNSIHCAVYVSNDVRNYLELKAGCRVIVEMIEESEQPKPSLIDIFPSNESITAEVFKSYVKIYSKHEALLLNSHSMISLDDDNRFIIKMLPENCNYATIDGKDVRNLTIDIHSPINLSEAEVLEGHTKKSLNLEKISRRCMKGILDECRIALDLSLGLRGRMEFLYDRENILICGGVGSGKTTVYKMLIEHYCEAPYFVYTFVINCRSLRGKKVETIQPRIKSAMSECAYYQPSILFLDDLESITNASLNDEENTPEVKNASRITDMLINTVTEYQKSHYISVVATCDGISKIGSKLRPAKGMQFFRTVLQIPNLEKVDRIDILRLTLEDKLCVPGDMNWNYYGNKTEGWMPQDLVDLAEKAKFVAWKRHASYHLSPATEKSKPPIVVTDKDIDTALKNFVPMSLHGAQLYKSGEHSWSDIGGLADTKKSLMEILQWPLKYPEIFKNAPIKLQSGVLLYGMPGTGKTMLAKAIASECGVNLISIKGPELLSKYVGASEESVRNVFERARRAKPCVLFFDEFDSLASRRGEDNTGVTDRVVNQLLTQLDGVEDREGVAIVAASSRPDLLDPAILRPGRLDKYLHCPLPNETDREAIFAVSCNSQNINQTELDLKELVQLSNGFTGADINAAITLARLSAFETALATAADNKIDAADIKVTQTHLVESVKSTKPSLSTAEKLKYDKIYARFSKGENFTEDLRKNQRVTLA
ncbi:peroxisome biogenesis protein 1 isoform X2 [Ooceraea biroi]|uniref:peroxisome biogenesis protein 1 isoform X2 n=1 Tax=Ooceraea biroi TaxID=2015173 RepID=UPI000F079316|nr:peroxisome biogenesis protein 1 isoform X2 [Ooceraea biroi]